MTTLNTITAEQKSQASELRLKALAMLNEASQIDGLHAYAIVHEHRHDNSLYLAWAHSCPMEGEIAEFMGDEYEPDIGEFVNAYDLCDFYRQGANVPVIQTGDTEGDE